jgi:hypothetical protein
MKPFSRALAPEASSVSLPPSRTLKNDAARCLGLSVRRRTLHRAIFLLKHALQGLANKNRPVHRRKSAELSSRPLVDSCNLTLRVNLDRANIECRLRKKYVHLHRIPWARRAFCSHVDAPAAYVAAAAVTALQDPVLIAPGEDHGKAQTKPLAISSLCYRFFHAGVLLRTAVPAWPRKVRTTATLRERPNV